MFVFVVVRDGVYLIRVQLINLAINIVQRANKNSYKRSQLHAVFIVVRLIT